MTPFRIRLSWLYGAAFFLASMLAACFLGIAYSVSSKLYLSSAADHFSCRSTTGTDRSYLTRSGRTWTCMAFLLAEMTTYQTFITNSYACCDWVCTWDPCWLWTLATGTRLQHNGIKWAQPTISFMACLFAIVYAAAILMATWVSAREISVLAAYFFCKLSAKARCDLSSFASVAISLVTQLLTCMFPAVQNSTTDGPAGILFRLHPAQNWPACLFAKAFLQCSARAWRAKPRVADIRT